MTYQEIYYPKTVRSYNFNPQPDITAYELALLLPLLRTRHVRTMEEMGEKLSKMPPEIMRHIRIVTE